VLQGTTHDTVCAEIGYGEKVSQRLWLKKLEEGIALMARHNALKTARLASIGRFGSCHHALDHPIIKACRARTLN
jgi:hypothetical protein